MRIFKILIYTAFIVGPLNVSGQYKKSADTLLDHMTGKWLLKGIIAGANIEHDITAAWVLGHQYIQFTETSKEKQADGTPSYEAIVYISRDEAKHQYDCLWLDNTSNQGLANEIIAHAPTGSNQIPLLFKIDNSTFFHTTLSYNEANDSWHWLMKLTMKKAR